MSYITEHPTHFRWLPYVEERVRRLQAKWPWRLYICTYWDHPPDTWDPRRWPVGFYDAKSFDVWGGGLDKNGKYTGYRGKPLPVKLGKRVFRDLMYAHGPSIDWAIYRGRMWWNPATGGSGWQDAPPGPEGSDPNHDLHIHITLR